MWKQEKRKEVYGTILRRLWKGNYLTTAKRGLMSEAGARQFFKNLEQEGFVIYNVGEGNRKKAEFTYTGIQLLKDYGILNKEFKLNGN